LTAPRLKAAQNFPHRIAVNNSFRLDPGAEVVAFGDFQWFMKYRFELQKHAAAYKVTWRPVPALPGVRPLELRRCTKSPPSFSRNPAMVFGGNSGHGALNLAYLFGACRILLLGFDLTGARGHNWHAEHTAHANEARFSIWIERFGEAATELRRLGVEVLNCSPGSALTCFDFANVEELAASLPGNTDKAPDVSAPPSDFLLTL
jgi:hypothetical protein